MTSQADILQAIKPLRMIFWGAVLILLNISCFWSLPGFRINLDIFNDLVGAILIAVGVTRLARLAVNHRYACFMRWAAVAAWLNLVPQALHSVVFAHPRPLSAMLSAIGLASMVGVFGFLWSMRILAQAAGLERSARSWTVTTILMQVFWVAPLSVLYSITAFVSITSQPEFDYDLGAGVVPVVALALLPLVHFFVSTSRMLRDARILVALPDSPRYAGRLVCTGCGRELMGLRLPRCPECGREFPSKLLAAGPPAHSQQATAEPPG